MTARVGAQGIEVLYQDPPANTARVGAQGIEVLYAEPPATPPTAAPVWLSRRRRISIN